MIVYLKWPLTYLSLNISIMDIFALILCPILTELRSDPRKSLFSFINPFIVGYKHIDPETLFTISSLS